MDPAPDFARLLRNTWIALLIGAALVAVCYWVVDRPVSFFVHNHGLTADGALRDLTYPPPIVQAWVPAVLAALMVRRAWGPFRGWERALVAASVGVLVADQFRESLSFVFGRAWPETWIDDNPSLVGSGAYGFHWFEGSERFGSFPSGHMARTLAAAAVVWVGYPRWRWTCVVASLAVAAGLIGMNYHFVGDVIGGSFVGGIVGAYAARFAKLGRNAG